MAVINSNSASLTTQTNLNKSQSTLGMAIGRLSSGLRINGAKDDAAGQSIANRMTSSIGGQTVAARNANDGISLAQTAEGALSAINNNLQRIRDLTVQAQNGSNSAADIDAIQSEVNQRMLEINRVTRETDFNGSKVLHTGGQANSYPFQVGADDGQKVSITMQPSDGWDLAAAGRNDGKLNTTNTTDQLVNGRSRTVPAQGFDVLKGNAITKNNDIPPGEGQPPVTAHQSYQEWKAQIIKNAKESGGAISLNPGDYPGAREDYQKWVSEETAKTGGYNPMDYPGPPESSGGSATPPVQNADGGYTPLANIDAALKAVDNQRSLLGASQNRFESIVTNLNNAVNNLSAARSRIQDADYSTEVSNLSRSQILQQAGNSVLTKANQVPQSVLSLLQ